MELHRSPLDARHRALGAKLTEFGGWDMPLSYPSGTLAEHQACRTGAALFDVSHLGTVRVQGADAFELLQRAFTNDLNRVQPGRAQYTHLCDPNDGSCQDDLIVWWHPDGSVPTFDVMPNASNTDGVISALADEAAAAALTHVSTEDITNTRAVLALQGPGCRTVLQRVVPAAERIQRFQVITATDDNTTGGDAKGDDATRDNCVLVAGTGYTGEDGVEMAVASAEAPRLWDELVSAGATPAGLGARDTLRLEAGLALHGHELGPGITPYQAGLGWVVRPAKGPFRGAAALAAELAVGPRRLLRGVLLEGRQPARAGATVFLAGTGTEAGVVSSGNFSPHLQCAIALAFLAPGWPVGTALEVEVRGRRLTGVVSGLPFYRRGSE